MNNTTRNSIFVFALCIVGAGLSARAHAQTALDKSLAPEENDEVSNVFRDMGVVQRRAMPKANRFLISNYGALDFSDGPYSMYGFNVNPGYAISDFWEIYINTTPFFFSSPRSIVGKVGNFVGCTKAEAAANNGNCAGAPGALTIGAIRPKFQLGAEILWAPAYGKDSLGSRRVVRSDTFFKFGVMQTYFQQGYKGLKFHLGVGKTYFLAKWLGFRLTASGNYMQTVTTSGVGNAIVPTKGYGFFAIVEAGFVFYL